jgi:hypothetical protein
MNITANYRLTWKDAYKETNGDYFKMKRLYSTGKLFENIYDEEACWYDRDVYSKYDEGLHSYFSSMTRKIKHSKILDILDKLIDGRSFFNRLFNTEPPEYKTRIDKYIEHQLNNYKNDDSNKSAIFYINRSNGNDSVKQYVSNNNLQDHLFISYADYLIVFKEEIDQVKEILNIKNHLSTFNSYDDFPSLIEVRNDLYNRNSKYNNDRYKYNDILQYRFFTACIYRLFDYYILQMMDICFTKGYNFVYDYSHNNVFRLSCYISDHFSNDIREKNYDIVVYIPSLNITDIRTSYFNGLKKDELYDKRVVEKYNATILNIYTYLTLYIDDSLTQRLTIRFENPSKIDSLLPVIIDYINKINIRYENPSISDSSIETTDVSYYSEIFDETRIKAKSIPSDRKFIFVYAPPGVGKSYFTNIIKDDYIVINEDTNIFRLGSYANDLQSELDQLNKIEEIIHNYLGFDDDSLIRRFKVSIENLIFRKYKSVTRAVRFQLLPELLEEGKNIAIEISGRRLEKFDHLLKSILDNNYNVSIKAFHINFVDQHFNQLFRTFSEFRYIPRQQLLEITNDSYKNLKQIINNNNHNNIDIEIINNRVNDYKFSNETIFLRKESSIIINKANNMEIRKEETGFKELIEYLKSVSGGNDNNVNISFILVIFIVIILYLILVFIYKITKFLTTGNFSIT